MEILLNDMQVDETEKSITSFLVTVGSYQFEIEAGHESIIVRNPKTSAPIRSYIDPKGDAVVYIDDIPF